MISKLYYVKIIGLLAILVLFVPAALAERFPRACRPNICQSKKDLPKRMRSIITSKDGLITSKPRVASRDFSPDEEPASPNISIPADRKITHACDFIRGILSCYDVVSFDGCPKTMDFVVTISGQKFKQRCDLVCTPNEPDPSTGMCECATRNCQTVS